jgi:hypothetical protein
MKFPNSCVLPRVIVIAALVASPVETAAAKFATGPHQSDDPGRPRERYKKGTR